MVPISVLTSASFSLGVDWCQLALGRAASVAAREREAQNLLRSIGWSMTDRNRSGKRLWAGVQNSRRRRPWGTYRRELTPGPSPATSRPW